MDQEGGIVAVVKERGFNLEKVRRGGAEELGAGALSFLLKDVVESLELSDRDEFDGESLVLGLLHGGGHVVEAAVNGVECEVEI